VFSGISKQGEARKKARIFTLEKVKKERPPLPSSLSPLPLATGRCWLE
jgi:hypothetical protein